MSPVIEMASTVCLYILAVAMCLTFYRLWQGPSPQDRTIALDLFSTLVVGVAGTLTALAMQVIGCFTLWRMVRSV